MLFCFVFFLEGGGGVVVVSVKWRGGDGGRGTLVR